MPEQNLIPVHIRSITSETADTRSFILSSGSGKIIYSSGQFLTFVFTKANGGEDRRNYSLSSSPAMDEPFQITVKRITNGAYSRWLVDHAKEGDILYTTGASGYFTLPDDIASYSQLFFFAAGSGITPVFSLIKTVLHLYKSIHILLVYSNTSLANAIFYDAFVQLQNKYPERLTINFLFSSSTGIPRRRLNVGMIEKVAANYFFSEKKSLFYLCGPLNYMRTIIIVLRTEGIPENLIRKEIFHIEKPVIKQYPPDVLKHTVTAILNGKEYRFTSQYPVTILQAAKAMYIPLPYSCEAGQCGTCSATCVSGKVWMGHNEVLLDEEIAKGRVLTCTGFGVSGDVVLKF